MELNWTNLWKFTLLLLISLLLTVNAILFYYTYSEFTYLLFEQYGQLSKLDKFRSILLTKNRFESLRILSAGSTFVATLVLIYHWKHLHSITHYLHKLLNYTFRLVSKSIHFWQSKPSVERHTVCLLFIAVALLRLYFLFQLPFHIDERFSYLYFVSKGLAVSLAYYPNPNNHILYTLLCNCADLFFEDPASVMKIPTYLLGIGLTGLFWFTVRNFSDQYTAFLSTVLFAFNGQVFYYGTQGRGYTLLLIFTVAAAASIVKIINSQRLRTASYGWFWLSCTFGFYTIPVFLYPFTGITLFALLYLIKQRAIQKIKWLIIMLILIAGSVILLYMPVFLFNGWTAVSGNSWVSPLPWDAFIAVYPSHLLELAGNLWGSIPYGQWITIGSLIYGTFLIFNKSLPLSVRQWIALLIICVGAAIVLGLLQRVLLFDRLLIYLTVFQYFFLAVLILQIIRLLCKQPNLQAINIVLVSLIFMVVNLYAFYRNASAHRFNLYDSFDNTAAILYQKQADRVFVNYYEYSLCIRFRYETSGKNINMDASVEPVAGSQYDYLVIHLSRPFPEQFDAKEYTKIYADAEVNIFERKRIL